MFSLDGIETDIEIDLRKLVAVFATLPIPPNRTEGKGSVANARSTTTSTARTIHIVIKT